MIDNQNKTSHYGDMDHDTESYEPNTQMTEPRVPPVIDTHPAFSNYPPRPQRSFTPWIYLSFFAISVIVIILGLYLKSSEKTISQQTIPPLVTKTPISQTQCQLYAVLESGENDSQIVTIDTKSKTIAPLGDIQKGMQIESIIGNFQNKALIANASTEGTLYSISLDTGVFTLLGQTHSGEMTAFTINQNNGSYWGWAKKDGLVSIDMQAQKDTVLYPSLKRGSALTWNTAGTLLYGAYKDNTELFTYDTAKNTYAPLAYNLPTATRGLTMLSGDILLGINSGTEGITHLYEFDPVQKLVTKELTIETPGSEPRGIAWDPSCGDPL
jgi:hypothetical protein